MSNLFKKGDSQDFRNISLTQLDPGQTLKGAFSNLQSAFRGFNTNAIIKDAYTHFIQELDVNDRPTKVDYYQASKPTKDEITCTADIANSKAGQYFTLQSPITKVKHLFYFVVSGNGVAPGLEALETPVALVTNDASSLVAVAIRIAINANPEFIATQESFLSNKVVIEYSQFGEPITVDLGTTDFTVARIQEGDSFLVGSVVLTYDVDGNPIYNGSTLHGMALNVYSAEFERSISLSIGNISVGVDLDSSEDSVSIKNSVSGQELVNPDGSIDANALSIGTEDGLTTGTQRVFVNNVRLQILASHDREQNITYADFGTKDQRITEIEYTSSTFPAISVKKVLTYTLVSGKYRRDVISWQVI